MKRITFIDLREGTLSVHLMEDNGKGFRVSDTVTSPIAEDGHFSLDIPAKNKEETYLSLPLSLLNFRIMEFPFQDRERIREVLPFELDPLVLGGSASIVFDACILSEDKGKHRVLVVYIAKEILRKIVGRLREYSLYPKMITSLDVAALFEILKISGDVGGMLLNPEIIEGQERMGAVVKEVDNPIVNLGKGEFSYTGDTDKIKKSLKLTALLAALLLLVFLSSAVFEIVVAKKEIAAARDDIRKTYIRMFPQEKKITSELYQARAHLKELQEKEKYFVGFSPLPFLLDLAAGRRQGVSFSEITMDKGRIIMKGECPSLSDVQQLKAGLERVAAGVEITDTKAISQGRTMFTITARGKRT
ncbi:MAG: GspL/Epsl periplasmic domain-containing protein [Thermodesulfovibrionales bacterium]